MIFDGFAIVTTFEIRRNPKAITTYCSYLLSLRILARYELKMSKNEDTPDTLLNNFVNKPTFLYYSKILC